MPMKLKYFTGLVCAAIAGCGGGSDSNDPPAAAPVASAAGFDVLGTYSRMTAKAATFTISGNDNSTRTSNLADFQKWTGTFSIARRAASDTFKQSTPACAQLATQLVDVKVSLRRARDGYQTEEGLTVAYDAGFKPICAFILDGSYWLWNLSEPLPTTPISPRPLGVQFTGDVFRTPEALTHDSSFTGMQSLDSDTASSAYLTFTYNLPKPITLPGAQFTPMQMLGEQTSFRFRIDQSGNVIGFQYVRTGEIANEGQRLTMVLNSATSVESLEGLFNGVTNTGRATTGVVLGDGTYYFLYSTVANHNLIAGVVQGTGTSASGSFSSSNGRDFNLEGLGVTPATINATYTPKASLNGSVAHATDTTSFTSTYNADYEVTPLLSTLAGTYAGTSVASTGSESSSLTISSAGAVSGIGSSGCTVAGTAAARMYGNAYDFSITFGGAPCLFANQTLKGIGYYDSVTKKLVAAAPNSTRSDGILFVGTKP